MAKEEVKEALSKAKGKGSGLLEEFKTFIARGNVLDMAVGVIIGGAFGKIVTSLTDNILMPLIGIIIGNIDISTKWNIPVDLWGNKTYIHLGIFIQNVIDFLLIAFCVFMMVKTINKFMSLKKKEEAKEAAVVKTDETKLLEEIRDLLKENNKKTK